MKLWAPYCGPAPLPGDWLSRWNFDPLLFVGLAGAALLWWRLAAAATRAERHRLGAAAAILLLLFVSPFCALSSALFSARVAHHVLLAAVVAPLLAYSMSDRISRMRGTLAFWTGVQALVFWAWHSPNLYAASLSSDLVYWIMQTTLLASAVAFWAAIRASSAVSATGALLISTVQMGLLGALITFAGSPLYAPHFSTTAPWGLAPLEDQQLAGLIMWVPSAGIYLGAALWLAHRWMRAEARAAA